ncbi:Uncharacterized protein TCM_010361 [Theobroma cacao]|uniref:Uncharacterized protein n=1 Tax=Theobroma cacao TaxID=3641 RepID=A0A061E7X9_THECC|nr:Uncharacterized protein TCM_010361 [Theobroma cacao]
MKRKRERKNRERGRAKRMVLMHFEEGKREFLLQFWRKKKAENFEESCRGGVPNEVCDRQIGIIIHVRINNEVIFHYYEIEINLACSQ